MIDVSSELQGERNALIAEIYEAFKDVSREGGVSWSETEVIDGPYSDEAAAEARARDTDQSWTELAEDETWDAGPGIGGWSFIDPIGFRYYIPAAMIRMLSVGYRAFSCHTLDELLTLPRGTFYEYSLDKWSRLDARQRKCVARFIKYMIECELTEDSHNTVVESWQSAYDSYWKSVA